MSNLARRAPVPSFPTIFTASSKWWNCTDASDAGMKSFTDRSLGEDRSVIVRNFVDSFFGIIPIGEVRKFERGGVEKGPAMRFSINSDFILSHNLEGYWDADFKLGDIKVNCGPLYPMSKPLCREESNIVFFDIE